MLLGATGTGKSATTAWLVERLQRPTLVMAPNKTLAAQLANEFRELLPQQRGRVLRLATTTTTSPRRTSRRPTPTSRRTPRSTTRSSGCGTRRPMSLLTRRDVVVVASVSCIYGLGTPQEYVDRMVRLQVGEEIDRDQLLRRLVDMQYTRNDLAFTRGTFRVRGDTVEIFPVYEELAVRIEMFGDEIERLDDAAPAHRRGASREDEELYVFPATHYVAGPERMERAIARHRGRAGGAAGRAGAAGQAARGAAAAHAHDLRHRDDAPGRLLLRHRELLAAHRRPRARHARRTRLLDYFPEDFLLVIDESHVTVPQIGAHVRGRHVAQADAGRPRLPAAVSAMDNRPLRWEEFVERIGQTVYLSATPGPYELGRADGRRRADHPADRPGRPRGRGQADQGPDRRPGARDPRCAPSATSGCWSPR